jgi:Phage integrase family
METVARAGINDLVFHDLRRTFATWLTQCGVDYAVIRMLRGEPLPGSVKYYIQNWDAPLRDAVTKLETYTRKVLEGDSVMQVPLTATSVPPSYVEQNVSMRNMVPRDRIELSTPAFSGLCSAN